MATPARLRLLLFAAAICGVAGVAATTRARLGAASAAPPDVIANENKTPAGRLQGTTFELALDVTSGFWRPEGEAGPKLLVHVFGEQGKAPQNPAPLIRVPEGTTAHVTIHNSLKEQVVVHGLYTRPGPDTAGVSVPAGESRDVAFQVGAPGTYYYWATSTGAKDYDSRGDPSPDSQLGGAIVVDPAGRSTPDRVFVIALINIDPDQFHDGLGTFVINGRSWPYTERLTYRAGDHARWRWINLSAADHPMHLHGAYFNVVATGDGDHEETYAPDAQRKSVTELVEDGHTLTLDWVPQEVGRWLFHCHLLPHFTPDNQLPRVTYPDGFDTDYRDNAAAPSSHDHSSPDGMTGSAGMAGLVMGITILPGTAPTAPAPPTIGSVRKLELVAQARPHGAGNTATMGFAVREGGRDLPASGQMPGPPIVLTERQPVEISIVNRLQKPTAIHWHGIELESYYDGVAGLGGVGRQVTPPISPGGTFVAKFAPSHAGTFIYHTHWHDLDQLTKGLYGPLVVLPRGQTFDPETDKIVLISIDGPKESEDDVLVNGTKAPEPMHLRAGTTYRFRLINITADNPGMMVSLLSGDTPLMWRAIAKDGADLPESQRHDAPAVQRVSVGETYDFEFVRERAGSLTLDVFRPADKRHVVTSVDVR